MWELINSDSRNSQSDSTGFFQITVLAKPRINLIFYHKSYEYLVISGIIPNGNMDLGSVYLFRSSFRACGPNYSNVYEGILNKYRSRPGFIIEYPLNGLRKEFNLKPFATIDLVEFLRKK